MWRVSYLIVKLFFRCIEYLRGIHLFVLINACGGKCKSIPRVGKGLVLKYPPHSGYLIGRGCDIGAFCVFDVPPSGKLKIEDNVKLTSSVFVSVANEVSIGEGALIAEGAALRDSQHQYDRGEFVRKQGLCLGKIKLGKDVWVGRCSSVLMNSELGDGCIVGAHSLVKEQSLASDGVYVGVPVRLVKMRSLRDAND